MAALRNFDYYAQKILNYCIAWNLSVSQRQLNTGGVHQRTNKLIANVKSSKLLYSHNDGYGVDHGKVDTFTENYLRSSNPQMVIGMMVMVFN
jgi:hypothetical protein